MIDTVIELSGDVTLDDRGTHNYEQLYNKPKINDVEIIGNKSLDDLGIQPKGDYLTEEVDPLFSSSPSAGITDEDIENWNNKSEFSGKYKDLEGLPFIPTNVSELNNDSGYINSIPSEYVTDTELQNTLKPYAKSEDVPDISGKQDTLISGTNLKTINSVSLLGSGNIVIKSGLTEVPVATENTVGGIKVGANLSIEPDGTLNAEVSGDLSTNYVDLYNKPKINGVTLNGNHTLSSLGIQPKGDYITEETDPLFSASPSANITEQDIDNWNSKSEFNGDYNDLSNKPTIPTKTSDLVNDSGFLTGDIDLDLSSKQDVLVSGENIKTINNQSILGSGNITIEGGGIAEIPVASADTLGGIKIGSNLTITEDGVLSAEAGIAELPVASEDTLGGVKIGNGLVISEDGTLNIEELIAHDTSAIVLSASENLTISNSTDWTPIAFNNTDVKIGSNISVDEEHTYGVKIGAGIEYVKVSMYLNLGAYVDGQVPLVQIHKNDVSLAQYGLTCQKSWGNDLLTPSNYIIPVQEGDNISLKAKGNNNDLMIRSHSLMIVEEYIMSTGGSGGSTIVDGGDDVPINTIVDFDGDVIPDGWIEVEDEVVEGPSVMTLKLSSNTEYTSSERYAQAILPLELNTSMGSKFKYEDNGVKIGPGVSKVLISGQLSTNAQTTGALYGIVIVPYRDGNYLGQYRSLWTAEHDKFGTRVITPRMIEVQEGDIIKLEFYIDAIGPKITIRDDATYLTVQEVPETNNVINTITNIDTPTATTPKSLISISGGGERTYTIDNWVWTPIDFNEVISNLGDGFEYNTETYEIKALKDMTVKIDAQISYFSTATGELNVVIIKNNDTANGNIAYANQYETFNNHAGTLNIVSAITDVVAGDVIQIRFSGLAGTYSINQRNFLSHMTVEEISNTVNTYVYNEELPMSRNVATATLSTTANVYSGEPIPYNSLVASDNTKFTLENGEISVNFDGYITIATETWYSQNSSTQQWWRIQRCPVGGSYSSINQYINMQNDGTFLTINTSPKLVKVTKGDKFRMVLYSITGSDHVSINNGNAPSENTSPTFMTIMDVTKAANNEEVVLYDNQEGSNGEIVLNDSVANYKYIEIFHINTAKQYCASQKIYNANNRGVDMQIMVTAGMNNIYFQTCRADIVDNKITPIAYGNNRWQMSNGTLTIDDTTNCIYIYRVVGYK